ncbi:chondroitin sulfate proteoglycan 4-like [Glandiceps talaboti]
MLTASFYGASYIRFPMTEASSETEVHLRFRTSRSRGLLFLAAGKTDYCIIELHSGGVQVWMDLGAGILELQSSDVKVNDLLWHNIDLVRVNENVNLTIDGIHMSTAYSSGASYELNIEEGVFVGGTGNLDKDYIGESDKSFRGCISDVMFNDVNVFETVQEILEADLKQYVDIRDVTWDCSPEFSAAKNDPISFTESESFVQFSRWEVEERGSFACWLKTHSEKGLLLYNAGEDDDFIAVELVDGALRMLVNKGIGKVNFQSSIKLNDKEWHWVLLRIEESFLEISIDHKPETLPLPDEEGEVLELRGPLYVGGLVERARTMASRLDLASMTGEEGDGSFLGCMRDIEINNVVNSLEDSRVTNLMKVGCVWEYPCTSKEPCIPDAECTESGWADYECKCNINVCEKPPEDPTDIIEDLTVSNADTEVEEEDDDDDDDKKNKKKKKKERGKDKEKSKKFLILQPLLVQEGGEATITSDKIQVNGDLGELGLRESQVMFKITRDPRFGEVVHDVLRRNDDSDMFTLLDIIGGRIIYFHDGSENFQDRLTFEIQILGNDGELPEALQGDNDFVFRIEVEPVNDIPVLILAPDSVFQLITNTKRVVSSELLNAVDPDNAAKDVTYTILNDIANMGYLENVDAPGKSIETFTQDDINTGKIYFVHDGAETKARLGLRVSDPEERSDPVSLRMEALELTLTIAKNTGIKVNPQSAVILNPDELKVVTNSPGQDLAIAYTVIVPPKFGEIQRMFTTEWDLAGDFTQRHVDKDKVRYSNSQFDSEHMEDSFQLQASCMEVTSDVFSVYVEVMAVSVNVVNNANLILDVIKEKTITSDHLASVLVNNIQNNYTITYTITREPEEGHLVRHSGGHLTIYDQFTQDDINAGFLGFRVKHHIRQPVNDTFDFQVSTTGYDSSIFTFSVMYTPNKLSTGVINSGLEVGEGLSKIITPENLYVQNPLADNFHYTVTVPPKHGSLQFLNPDTMEVSQWGVTSFTDKDIMEGLLEYQQDDTEAMEDYFKFMAMAVTNEPELKDSSDAVINGVFNITISMKNDNKPVRTVEKLFRVVESGERLLTDADLQYTDADIDFDDDNLEYIRQRIPNGELVDVNNVSVPVFKFKQGDLRAGKLLFKHNGAPFGRMVFFVYDDQRTHFASGILEIDASEPYIIISENSGLMLQKGKGIVLSGENLTIDTNLNAKDKNVEFLITDPPKHGRLFKKGEEEGLENFNLEALKNERIRYQHDDSENLEDSFNFTVKIKDVEMSGQVHIKIFLKSHQVPPEVAQNRLLVVKEMGVATIKKSQLRVTHKESGASDLVFRVTTQPLNGYLRLLTEESAKNLGEVRPTAGYSVSTASYDDVEEYDPVVEVESEFIVSFTQNEINQGRVQYVEMAPRQLSDRFTFEVTNGIMTVTDQIFDIEIIPDIIPLRVKDFEVREGGSKALTEKYIKINNKHMKEKLVDFIIVSKPKHGHIEHTRMPKIALMSFTSEDVDDEFIYYAHDGSDSEHDQFSLFANSTNSQKVSNIYSINVTITPVNDEPPEITINNGMEVFINSVTTVTTEDLSAEDEDTEEEELVFSLTTPTNGFMALTSDPKSATLNFTQADIVNGRVLFVHNGARTGGFRFQVNDGQHSAKRQIFSITAKPLVILIDINNGMNAYPESVQPITADNLRALTNERPSKMANESIIFRVTRTTRLGKIVKIVKQEESPDVLSYQEISEFNQKEINEGLIAYKHEEMFSKWSEEDSFIFDVHRMPARNITDQLFLITVSYENIASGGKSPLLTNTGVKVSEGDVVTITNENLDASNLYSRIEGELENYIVEYNLTKLPMHGVLVLHGNNITERYVTFQQEDLNKGAVRYIHDHSDTMQDSFGFNVLLRNTLATPQDGAQNDGEVSDYIENSHVNLHDNFNISVTPVNDQPFKLLTLAPSMDIVQGFDKIFKPENLETHDPDTPPEGIYYKILDGPSNGKVALTSDHSVAIQEFTQKHINDGVLIFIHNGGKEQGAFYFRVSDGVHKDVFKMFNFNVIPLSLTLINNTGVQLLQGDSSAPIMRENLGSTTNGNREDIMYNITKPPSSGMLLINEQPQTTFSQIDVDNDMLAYLQTDRSASEDDFQFVIFNSENVIPANTFTMKVQAIIKKKHITLRSGNSNPITINELDATELANRSLSNPVFEIIQFPQYCQLLNTTTSQPISQFSHQDIINKQVLISADILEMDNQTRHMSDSIILSLKAKNVQPAQVEIPINIKAMKQKRISATDETATTELAEISNLLVFSGAQPDVEDSEEDTNKVKDWLGDVSKESQDSEVYEAETSTSNISNAIGGEPGSSLVDPTAVSGSQLAVIIPIIVVIILATVVVIVVIWRMRRRDSKPANIDSPYPEPDEAPLPVVHPQRPGIQGSPGHRPASTATFGVPPQNNPMPPTSPGPSPGVAERSPLAPQVTVTPLGQPAGMEDPRYSSNYQNMAGVPGPSGQSVVSLASSGSGVMVYNMQADPEMAEHCRTSNPTLQKNQYWV